MDERRTPLAALMALGAQSARRASTAWFMKVMCTRTPAERKLAPTMAYGTKVIYEGASGHAAEQLAKALGPDLVQVGSRRLWEYPKGGHSGGSPRLFGGVSLSFVSVYYDGAGVFLSMAGAGAPTSRDAMSAMTQSLGINVRCDSVEMVSNTEI